MSEQAELPWDDDAGEAGDYADDYAAPDDDYDDYDDDDDEGSDCQYTLAYWTTEELAAEVRRRLIQYARWRTFELRRQLQLHLGPGAANDDSDIPF